jgi:hypothetical protein
MRTLGRGALAAAAVVLGVGCGKTSQPADPDAVVAITVNALGTLVATVVVVVDAPDIDPPLVFNVRLENQIAVGTLRMPPGQLRTITARAFESGGALAAEGSVTLPVVERGPNPRVSIPMVSRAGHVPISIQIGPVAIEVNPAVATLAVGTALQLTVRITAAGGDELVDAPEWATTDPTVLEVTSDGLVTALREGQAEIVATYAGVAGVSRISTTGGPPWVGIKRFGTSVSDWGYDLAVDALRSVYVAGATSGEFPGQTKQPGYLDVFVAKLDSIGNVSWVTQFGTGAVDGGVDHLDAIAVDESGGAFVAGFTHGAFPGYTHAGGTTDAFVARLGTGGTLAWVVQLGTALPDRAEAIAIDSLGSAHVAGSNGAVAFASKLDRDGNVQWTTHIGADRYVGQGVGVDASGNTYVSGRFLKPETSLQTIFVAKLDPSGTVSWVREVPYDPAHLAGVYPLMASAADAQGNSYVVASYALYGPGGGEDAFAVKVDTEGNVVWQVPILGAFEVRGAALDPAGNVLAAVSTEAIPSYQYSEVAVAKLDPSGNLLWLTRWAPGVAGGIAAGPDGASYCAGEMPSPQGDSDAFVAKLDPEGHLQ